MVPTNERAEGVTRLWIRMVALVVCCVVALLGTAVPATASATTLYERLDASRAAAGLTAVARSASVQQVAQAWAVELARSGTLRHNPSYSSQIPSGWTRAGENVAYAGDQSSPDAVIHEMWMHSPGHRANILGGFNTVGIGRAVDSRGRVWAVQVFASYAITPSPIGPYTDVYPGQTHHDDVVWVSEQGISRGYGDGSFGRLDPVTREQMAAFLYRASGSPAFTPPHRATFVDVPAGSGSYRAVEWLAAQRITLSTGRYEPLDAVTRGQMAAFLARAEGPSSLAVPNRPTFSDVSAKASYFTSVEWMAEEGVTTVASVDPRYRPARHVTREQMAAFLHRVYG